MIGAIIGDVVGSYYEVLETTTKRSYEDRIQILDEKVPLFNDNCSYTDDTVLTCAIYDAIINGNCDYEKYLREYGLKEINLGVDKYGRSRFGKGFVAWLKGNYMGNSYGNGSAMRISPIGFMFNDIKTIKEESYKATIPSHNHPDSIKGAEAIAVSIYLLRNGYSKEDLTNYIKNNYYDLDYNLEDLQRNNKFTSKTSICVPEAIYLFLVSNSFEDAIRKSISIGGDTDTIAAIVGSLAEAYYSVPEELIKEVQKYLTEDIIKLMFHDKKIVKGRW
jgi:ADP-ribosylglycohydrolase